MMLADVPEVRAAMRRSRRIERDAARPRVILDEVFLREHVWPNVAVDFARPIPAAVSTPCLIWTGNLCGFGYAPYITYRGQYAPVYRALYETFVERVPPGLLPDHLCMVKPCVNWDHLEPVTNAENARRAWRARGVPPCPHGEERKSDCPACTAEWAEHSRRNDQRRKQERR